MRVTKILIPSFLFLLFAVIYVHNLAIGVYAGDVGDFVTASFVGGVPHAPGYPLFTILGFLTSRLPIFPSPAYAVGLVSALAGCVALVFVYAFCLMLTKDKFASLMASLVLGFSFLFWFYSEVAEVFVLNSLFVVLLFFLAAKLSKNPSKKLLYLFSFFLGLSLTNHQTIIFIFPSLFLLIFSPLKKLFSLKTLLFSFLFILLGFSLYLYPYFATLRHPIINWDPVTNISSFLHLILREDYGTFNAGPFGTPTILQRFIILQTYASYTIVQLTIPVMLLALIGAVVLWRKEKLLCLSLLLGLFLIGPVFIFYAGFPPIGNYFDGVLERFLLASHVIIIFFFAVGLSAFLHVLFKVSPKKISKILFSLVFLIIPVMLYIYNFPKTNLSHFYLTQQFAQDILEPLPKNTMLFTSGDTATFNVWYVRYGLNLRKDVSLVNLGGLAVDKSYQPYVDRYLTLHPRTKSSDLTAAVLLFIKSQRPVFSLEPLQPSKKDKFTWIPVGLSYELLGNNASLPSHADFLAVTHKAWTNLHIPAAADLHKNAYGDVSAADVPSSYVTAMLSTGDFLLAKYKDTLHAKEWFDKALALDPTQENVHAELGIWYIASGKQCLSAETEFKKAISLNPLVIPAYILLYESYLDCSHNSVLAKQVALQFQEVFHQHFSEALKSYFATKKQ